MTNFTFIKKEIPFNRKCYIICERYDADDFLESLARLAAEAFRLGAAEVFLAAREDGVLPEGEAFLCSGLRFLPFCHFDILEKTLAPAPPEFRPFRIKQLAASNAPLFSALHNEAFFDVPNAASLGPADTEKMLADGACEAGFFMDGGAPVGVFELSYAKEPPEISAIAVNRDLWGHGAGKRALRTLEQKLYGAQHLSVSLVVCDINARACALYARGGYSFVRQLSSWFRAVR